MPQDTMEQTILEFVAKHPPKKFIYVVPSSINPRTGKPYEITSTKELTPKDLDSIRRQLAGSKNVVGGVVPEWDLSGFEPNSPKDTLKQISRFIAGDISAGTTETSSQG
jgi:hypothetical protein